jgi:hypothetical protein
MVNWLLGYQMVMAAGCAKRNAAQICQSDDYQEGRDSFEFSETKYHYLYFNSSVNGGEPRCSISYIESRGLRPAP